MSGVGSRFGDFWEHRIKYLQPRLGVRIVGRHALNEEESKKPTDI